MKDYSEITTGPILPGEESLEDLQDRQEYPQAGDNSLEDFEARKRHLGDDNVMPSGSINTQGDSPPHNMSRHSKQATGKEPRNPERQKA